MLDVEAKGHRRGGVGDQRRANGDEARDCESWSEETESMSELARRRDRESESGARRRGNGMD